MSRCRTLAAPRPPQEARFCRLQSPAWRHFLAQLGNSPVTVGGGNAVPDLQKIAVDVEINSPPPADRFEAMQQAWLARCPI